MFKIRPYTFEFLSAIQPFYEIMATSNLDYTQLSFIIDYLENILNKVVIKNNKKLAKNMKDYKAEII